MNIKLRRAVPVLLSALLVGLCPACGFLPIGGREPVQTPSVSAPAQSGAGTDTGFPYGGNDSHSPDPAAGLDQSQRYAWSLLRSTEEQSLYLRIRDAVAQMSPSIVETGYDAQTMLEMLDYIRIDYPEYFWLDGTADASTRTLNGVTQDVTMNFRYTMSAAEQAQAQAAVEEAAAECLSAIDPAWSDYDKIKAVYDWVIRHTAYEASVTDQSLYSVLVEGYGVCAGYARTTQYLLNRLGIPCTYVTGTARGGGHAWNLVEADGAYYYLDATWGDPIFADGDQDPDHVSYAYFCVTTEDLLRTHSIDDTIPVPLCTATACNYYVHNGLALDSYDSRVLSGLLTQAARNRQGELSVLFTSDQAYRQAVSALFERQEIFSLLDDAADATGLNANHVSYSVNDQQRTVTINLTYGN